MGALDTYRNQMDVAQVRIPVPATIIQQSLFPLETLTQ